MHIFVMISLLEDPVMQVFKNEIREKLEAQRHKQKNMEAQLRNIVAT